MTLRVLGLDLSLAATGIAWTCDAHGRPDLGVRTAASRNGGHERIFDINVEVASAARCDPHLAVIEGLFVGHNNNSLQLAELHGIVKQWLWQQHIPYVLVTPPTRAVYATGNGRASKEDVLTAVQRTYAGRVYLRDTDQADALVLLAMACDHYGQPLVELPQTHRRALSSVDWPVLASPVPGDATRAPSPGAGARQSTLPIEAGLL